MKQFFMGMMLSMSAFANSDLRPEQCLLIRDDYKHFEVLVPKGIPIRTKADLQSYSVPKKILPNQFRQIELPETFNYVANIKLRNISSGASTLVSVNASQYIKNGRTQEQTYYSSDVLPGISVTLDNGIHVVIAGNKFVMGPGGFELHIAPCSGLESFTPAADQVLDNDEVFGDSNSSISQ